MSLQLHSLSQSEHNYGNSTQVKKQTISSLSAFPSHTASSTIVSWLLTPSISLILFLLRNNSYLGKSLMCLNLNCTAWWIFTYVNTLITTTNIKIQDFLTPQKSSDVLFQSQSPKGWLLKLQVSFAYFCSVKTNYIEYFWRGLVSFTVFSPFYFSQWHWQLYQVSYRTSHILGLFFCFLVISFNLFTTPQISCKFEVTIKVLTRTGFLFPPRMFHSWCLHSTLHSIKRCMKYWMSGCPDLCDAKIAQWVQIVTS